MSKGWPDTPSDVEPRLVTTAYGPCAVAEEGPGDAPVVVFIHGVPGSVRDFRWIAPVLSDRLRVIRFDMPGFGQTPLSRDFGFDIVDRANFVACLLRTLDLRDVTLIGHSMGGPVAAAVAHHHRGLARRIGLWASPGLRVHRKFRLTFPTHVARAMRWPVVGGVVAEIVRRGFAAQGFPSDVDRKHVQIVMNYAAGLDFDAHRRRVLALSLPTMVAYCDDDHLVETDICAELAHACPPGPRAIYPNGGHNLQKTHAIALGETLLRWLQKSL